VSQHSNPPVRLLRRLQSDADPEFEALLRIYTEAHPIGELKPPDTLRRMIQRPEYFFLILLQGSNVVAFSISICLPHSDAALLEYMAVDAASRNCGIGGELFRRTAEFESITGRSLLIEVDSDKCPAAEQADRERRKIFYRRLGCLEIEGLSYIMPKVSSAAPPPMEMLVYRNTLPQQIEKARIRNWLESCYCEVYGASADDPRIDAMLAGLPANVALI
jgi:hypothetical protein